jgi:hypothetical protein
MKKFLAVLIPILMICFVANGLGQEKILNKLERGGIWKVDRPNHRCLVDPGVWKLITFDKKEQILQVIYVEEKTWWELYDMYSGKLLGKVSSWGWKIYP